MIYIDQKRYEVDSVLVETLYALRQSAMVFALQERNEFLYMAVVESDDDMILNILNSRIDVDTNRVIPRLTDESETAVGVTAVSLVMAELFATHRRVDYMTELREAIADVQAKIFDAGFAEEMQKASMVELMKGVSFNKMDADKQKEEEAQASV